MRYGVIGTGWIAKSFIDGAREVCGSEFSAVYSRPAESGNKFAAENKIEKVYTDINEFANGDFDAVYIASPNRLHYEQSKLMLENGKHVICEKPITVEPEELEELQELAEKNGLSVDLQIILSLQLPSVFRLVQHALPDAHSFPYAYASNTPISPDIL